MIYEPVHLSAHVSSSGGTEDDIKARLGKARAGKGLNCEKGSLRRGT